MTLDEAKTIVEEWVGKAPEPKVIMALFVCIDEGQDALYVTVGEAAEQLFPEEFAKEDD